VKTHAETYLEQAVMTLVETSAEPGLAFGVQLVHPGAMLLSPSKAWGRLKLQPFLAWGSRWAQLPLACGLLACAFWALEVLAAALLPGALGTAPLAETLPCHALH